MARRGGGKKAAAAMNVGKGKVTPVQIAFLVERFLADNNFANTVVAFRDEASDLFAKTKSKEAPKGLLGLAEILDEYITLKEQRISVDQDKRRVEMAFQGMNDVIRTYHSTSSSPPLLHPSPPPPPLIPPTTAGSPPGCPAVHGSFLSNRQQSPDAQARVAETNRYSTPMPTVSVAEKRKASKAAVNAPPPPKKSRTQPNTTNPVNAQGDTSSARAKSNAAVEGLSVAKSLFTNQLDSRANSSSPKTPPQEVHLKNEKSSPNPEKLPLSVIDGSSSNASQKISSVISSETIIISPLKNKGYYSVERSYRVCSPLKPNSERTTIKRDQVKGRLDFDRSLPLESSEEIATTDSSPSTTYEETPGCFDFDLPDFDFLDGGDISKLLVDMDMECERMLSSQQQSSTPLTLHARNEKSVCDGILTSDEGCVSTLTGPDTVTSMRSITRCIQITSPAKVRKN